MQNYLFIDIDGPLLPGKNSLFLENRKFFQAINDGMRFPELLENHTLKFDPWGVRAHNLLAKYGNAKIILVTNWRRWADVDDLKNLFDLQGLEFEYADPVSCARRGISSERYHDIAEHMESYIEKDARCLIIDDYNLQALNLFFRLEGEEGERTDRDVYQGPPHNDLQVGIVQTRDNSIKHDIRFKWLDVDYYNGLTFEQFKIGAEFFGIDWDQLNYHEFGIPIKTEEEKQKEREDFDRLCWALIV